MFQSFQSKPPAGQSPQVGMCRQLKSWTMRDDHVGFKIRRQPTDDVIEVAADTADILNRINLAVIKDFHWPRHSPEWRAAESVNLARSRTTGLTRAALPGEWIDLMVLGKQINDLSIDAEGILLMY